MVIYNSKSKAEKVAQKELERTILASLSRCWGVRKKNSEH